MTALRRASRTPCSPPCLPPAFLSTAATPTPPWRAAVLPLDHIAVATHRTRFHPLDCCCRLYRARLYHWRQRHCSRRARCRPPAIILLLHHHCIARSRCVVLLRPPSCQVLLKAHVASICFKYFSRFVASVSDACCKS
jgi:hypothetical protein